MAVSAWAPQPGKVQSFVTGPSADNGICFQDLRVFIAHCSFTLFSSFTPVFFFWLLKSILTFVSEAIFTLRLYFFNFYQVLVLFYQEGFSEYIIFHWKKQSCLICAFKKIHGPWPVWLSGLNAGLRSKGLMVQFSVRAHAWVAGQLPSMRRERGHHTLMFLSLSFFPTSPLSKNK